MSSFKKAVRSKQKMRVAIAGPSGSGKTYTALTWAHTVGTNVAAVDTEHGSMSLYQGLNGWSFDSIEPMSYDPGELAALIREADADGYDSLVVDSWSAYWSGKGGMLDLAKTLKSGSDQFSGWAKAGERERDMIEAILSFSGHVFLTLRTKNERVIEEDDRGKKKVVDVVMKPVQRDGIEYEVGFFAEMDLQHVMSVTKSRIHAVPEGTTIEQPDAATAIAMRDWLAQGADTPTAADLANEADVATSRDQLMELLGRVHSLQMNGAAVKLQDGTVQSLREYIIARGRSMVAGGESS